MNNLKLFRELSGIKTVQLSKLIVASSFTYLSYEKNKMIIPKDQAIMISLIYSIDVNELFVPEEEISNETIQKLKSYSAMTDEKRLEILTTNLVGKIDKPVTSRILWKIRENINVELNKNKGLSQIDFL